MDPIIDEQLAMFVVNSHRRSHPDFAANGGDTEEEAEEEAEGGRPQPPRPSDEDHVMADDDLRTQGALEPQQLDQETLKKYIAYARAFVKPVLQDVDSNKV